MVGIDILIDLHGDVSFDINNKNYDLKEIISIMEVFNIMYIPISNGSLAISLTNYNALETDGNRKKATGQTNGTQLEVFDDSTGKITKYAEAINGFWYER